MASFYRDLQKKFFITILFFQSNINNLFFLKLDNIQLGATQNVKILLKMKANSIGLIRSNWYINGKLSIISYGTGFAISNRMVITCTHNIYSEKRKIHADQVFFVPALRQGKVDSDVIKYRISKNNIKSGIIEKSQNDEPSISELALLITDEKMNIPSFFKIGQISQKEVNNRMKIIGYPSKQYSFEKNLHEVFAVRHQNYGRLHNRLFDKDIINYTMRTGIGFSGSPVLIQSEEGIFKIAGVHTHKGLSKDFNSGLMFHPKVMDMLKGWVKNACKEFQLEQGNIFEPYEGSYQADSESSTEFTQNLSLTDGLFDEQVNIPEDMSSKEKQKEKTDLQHEEKEEEWQKTSQISLYDDLFQDLTLSLEQYLIK